MKLLKSCPIPDNAKEIYKRFSFPDKSLEKEEIFFSAPYYMCIDKEGYAYVSDHSENLIHKYDPFGNLVKIIGRGGQGPGELLRPRMINADKRGNIYILDAGNGRIQILGSDGGYLRSFKTFKGYSSMAVSADGMIYLSPLSENPKDPLVEVFSETGECVKFFGERKRFRFETCAHNETLLSLGPKGDMYLAWANFPIIRRYAKTGELISEFEVTYKLLEERAKSNLSPRVVGKDVRLMNLIQGIHVTEDKIYLFLFSPRIEILELSLEGDLVGVYWKDRPYGCVSRDFFVRDGKGEKQLFYILNIYPNQEIEVFSVI
jgi:hypothetical protein